MRAAPLTTRRSCVVAGTLNAARRRSASQRARRVFRQPLHLAVRRLLLAPAQGERPFRFHPRDGPRLVFQARLLHAIAHRKPRFVLIWPRGACIATPTEPDQIMYTPARAPEFNRFQMKSAGRRRVVDAVVDSHGWRVLNACRFEPTGGADPARRCSSLCGHRLALVRQHRREFPCPRDLGASRRHPADAGRPFSTSKRTSEWPVISAGFGNPISASSVGAMSCSAPPSISVAGRPT